MLNSRTLLLHPDMREGSRIADWLLDAGLTPLLFARTPDEAILLSRSAPVELVILDEAVPTDAATRLLQHLTTVGRAMPRVICLQAPRHAAASGAASRMPCARPERPVRDHALARGAADTWRRTSPAEGGGLPLGLKPDAAYRDQSMPLPGPGILCMFSDRLCEHAGQDETISPPLIAASLAPAIALAERRRLPEAARCAAREVEALLDRTPNSQAAEDDVAVVCIALAAP
ncbi:MAG TPA: SpoIIE family protein phosphatase [Acetobacteraceae bacterium]|nr:SpoIIE family protein phosphatase [Acetobacteraceae bacterium]